MNKTLSVMLAAGLLVSGVAGAAEKPAVAFTPEQEARIGEIAKDYLLAHPEVLVEVSQKLQAQQQEKQQQAMTAAVVQNQAALLNDKGTPSYGPADAKVTVVEFFDYQCIYCARLAPELEKVIKANQRGCKSREVRCENSPRCSGDPGWHKHTCAEAGLQRYPGPGGSPVSRRQC